MHTVFLFSYKILHTLSSLASLLYGSEFSPKCHFYDFGGLYDKTYNLGLIT
jgi:hypothetical protein